MSLGSVYAQNLSLDSCYGSSHASIWPSTIVMRLYVGDPTAGGVELSSQGGYAAASVANNSTYWPNASGGQQTNGTTITFPTSTAQWSGNPTYFWLTDSVPNLLDGGPLSTPIVVPGAGYVISFPPGSIIIQAT